MTTSSLLIQDSWMWRLWRFKVHVMLPLSFCLRDCSRPFVFSGTVYESSMLFRPRDFWGEAPFGLGPRWSGGRVCSRWFYVCRSHLLFSALAILLLLTFLCRFSLQLFQISSEAQSCLSCVLVVSKMRKCLLLFGRQSSSGVDFTAVVPFFFFFKP